MLYIQKGNEPTALSQYKSTLNANYDDFSGEPKESVRQALLHEQGYLCAYCMRRINTCSIEHYIPQSKDSSKALDYNNFLGVCDGNGNQRYQSQTCDKRRGNADISINPLNQNDIATIYYQHDGKICSNNPDFQKDFDVTFNLNGETGYLKRNRKEVLDVLKRKAKTYANNQSKFKVFVNQQLARYCTLDAAGQYPAYAGILIWQLQKWQQKF